MSPFATMTTLNIVLGILFIIGALLFLIPGAMATAGKLPGNNVIGLRLPEVRKNESTWVTAHRVVGPFALLAGVAMAIGAAFAFIAEGWVWVAPAVALIAAVAAFAVGGNYGTKAAKLADAALHEPDESAEEAPAPQVNLDALRRAAGKADGEE
ncbi:SdpI family protein [Corynebacterium gottingense]|uniref:SdpI family protein n=1 Tax=Corynebacterium gottingense TaxID=2041036 RepID=UPI0038CF3263